MLTFLDVHGPGLYLPFQRQKSEDYILAWYELLDEKLHIGSLILLEIVFQFGQFLTTNNAYRIAAYGRFYDDWVGYAKILEIIRSGNP
jgi:hypothetical protein